MVSVLAEPFALLLYLASKLIEDPVQQGSDLFLFQYYMCSLGYSIPLNCNRQEKLNQSIS